MACRATVLAASLIVACAPLSLLAAAPATAPAAPATNTTTSAPSLAALQQDFVKLKFGMFLHFGMETYKDVEWVPGYVDPAGFNPGVKTIDTDAWADAAKAAGMQYAVLTAKHVSGFCLWDSEYTTYDVMNQACPYQQDLVAQFVKSFTSRGLKVGLYYCWRSLPFKKHFKVYAPECDPATHNLQEQNEFAKKQIAELLKKYPEVFYVWNDGLDPRIMPAAEATAFFRGTRPDVLASGNWWDWKKKGHPYLDICVTEGFQFPKDNTHPAETCWRLEPKWFWKAKSFQPAKAEDMVRQLNEANGRHANFLLNVAPGPDGQLEEASVAVLKQIGLTNRDRPNPVRHGT